MTTVDRRRWLAERIRFLEGELEGDVSDAQRTGIDETARMVLERTSRAGFTATATFDGSVHGVVVHSGSACSSESLEPSPVLEAMGVDAERSLRVSVGWSTTDDDITAFLTALPTVVEKLRALRFGEA